MSTRNEIITVLLKHGPLHVDELVEIIDLDKQRVYYDEDYGGFKWVVKEIVWSMLNSGELALRQDRTLAVVKGNIEKYP